MLRAWKWRRYAPHDNLCERVVGVRDAFPDKFGRLHTSSVLALDVVVNVDNECSFRNARNFYLHTQLFRMCGVDLTRIYGIDVTTALTVISELATARIRCSSALLAIGFSLPDS